MVEDGGGVIGLLFLSLPAEELPMTEAELVVLSSIIVTMSLLLAFSGDVVTIGDGFGSPAATSLNSDGVKVPMVDP